MAKDEPPPRVELRFTTVPDPHPERGCGFCLLNTMLILAAPSALVALAVKAVRR